MAQPNPYSPTRDFSEDEADGVSGRSTILTAALDTELSNISTSITQIEANLSIIQRDDGNLRDEIVTIDSLSAETLALISAIDADSIRGAWVTATAYALGDIVAHLGISYLCTIAHTSGTFATDLAADKWGAMAGQAVISIVDSAFSMIGSGDATKIAQFEVDGITTGTTRTYTLPNASGTVALIDRAQTFTAAQIFAGNVTIGDAAADTLTINASNWTVNTYVLASQPIGSFSVLGYGFFWGVTADCAQNGSTLRGTDFSTTANTSAFTIAEFDGHLERTRSNTASTISQMNSYAGIQYSDAAGTVTQANVFYAFAPVFNSTGVFTSGAGFRAGNMGNAKVANSYGFIAQDHTNSTILMAAYRSQMTSGTGKWGAYFDGTASNHFNGMTLIGVGATSSLTSARLQIFEASDANLDFYRYAADSTGTWLRGIKSRNATINTHTVVQSGDNLLLLSAYGSDGSAYQQAAQIAFVVDGTPGATDMPGRIVFSTSPDGSGTVAECARFSNAGAFILAKRNQEKQGAAVNSANNLTVGSDGNYFQINNATQINLLDNTNWQGGSVVTLKFNSTPTVKHNQSASTTFRPIKLAGAADFVATADDTLTLIYDATDQVWYQRSSAVI